MVGERWDQELGHGLAGQVRRKLRRYDETLAILFKFEDRGRQRHFGVRMGPKEFLAVRLADENRDQNATDILSLAEALADAESLGIKGVGRAVFIRGRFV